jgi:hypothetical protein
MALPYQLHNKARQQQQQQQGTLSSSLQVLKGKPFWIWDKEEHLRLATETNEQCCFNHIVGLPLKDYDGIKKEHPLYDYEKLLYDSLLNVDGSFKDKHLWVKKATGLGVTEFMLRITAWLCTKDDHFVNAQICIVTGPNIDIAIKLIKRLKGIFERPNKLGLVFQNKETVFELNGCVIEAFPSNHLDAYRALENPKFIFLDEADMFRKSEQEDVRHVSERYIAKSDPYIVMVSTPDRPGGLFYNIENEKEDTCLYKRLKLDYRYGLGKIYTQEEIDRAKQSPGFGREYELQYLGKIGNVFSPLQVDKAVQLGEQFKDMAVNQFTIHGCGIDPGFGSSKTAIVLTEHMKEESKIRVLFAEEYDHPNPEDIADICFNLHRKYQNTWLFVDGANRGFITQLKVNFGESLRWEKAEDVSPHSNRVIPVNFNTDHKQMLTHLHLLVNKEYLAIPQQYDKLILSLRTAITNEYTLDKEATSYDDLLDALRLSLKAYKMK